MSPWPVPTGPGDLDDDQDALARAVAGFCEDHAGDLAPAAREGNPLPPLWTALAGMGVLALATPEGGGGAKEVAAASAVLGSFGFPGPLVATVVAGQVLCDERRPAVLRGEAMCALGPAAVVPWASRAVAWFDLGDDGIWLARPVGELQHREAIGGEPAAAVKLERTAALDGGDRGLALADVAAASYLAGAAGALLAGAARHAAERHQFDRPIGDFQGVAFPLADVHARLAAASDLAWQAAVVFDEGRADRRVAAAMARLSARRAALAGLYAAHQVYGAMGFAADGPMAGMRARIAQTAALPPAPAALGRVVFQALGAGDRPAPGAL